MFKASAIKKNRKQRPWSLFFTKKNRKKEKKRNIHRIKDDNKLKATKKQKEMRVTISIVW